jgi:hypothetical protein
MLDAAMFITDSRASDNKATEFEIRNEINFIPKTSSPPKTAITPIVIFFTILKYDGKELSLKDLCN